ncbi:transposase [Nitrosomonas sp. Nm51]|uniref:transposase n=1 Tax=Nitrosomonas sp. Nm51 TaxID=133720 RepID=UPI0035276938
MKRGREHGIQGAVDCAGLNPIVRYDDTINAQSTVALLQQIRQQHPAARIYVICDNARYYRSRIVTDYLSDSKTGLIFLPPYASNPNLIERYWRFFKKEILYGEYYETFLCSNRPVMIFLPHPSAIKNRYVPC